MTAQGHADDTQDGAEASPVREVNAPGRREGARLRAKPAPDDANASRHRAERTQGQAASSHWYAGHGWRRATKGPGRETRARIDRNECSRDCGPLWTGRGLPHRRRARKTKQADPCESACREFCALRYGFSSVTSAASNACCRATRSSPGFRLSSSFCSATSCSGE